MDSSIVKGTGCRLLICEGAQVVVLAGLPDARLPLPAGLVERHSPEPAAVLHDRLQRHMQVCSIIMGFKCSP